MWLASVPMQMSGRSGVLVVLVRQRARREAVPVEQQAGAVRGERDLDRRSQRSVMGLVEARQQVATVLGGGGVAQRMTGGRALVDDPHSLSRHRLGVVVA